MLLYVLMPLYMVLPKFIDTSRIRTSKTIQLGRYMLASAWEDHSENQYHILYMAKLFFCGFLANRKSFPLNHLLCTVHNGLGLMHRKSFPVNSVLCAQSRKFFPRSFAICDPPWENRPSSHLVMIVEIPILKFLIGVTSFCSC